MRTAFGLALVGLIGGLAAHARADDHHEGPHKGVVVEWGEEDYHPEIVIDAKAGTVTVYVYGNHNDLHKKKLKAIDSKTLSLVLKTTPPTTIKLDSSPEKGDPKGSSTKFAGKDDVLKKEMKWEGTLSGKVGAKEYKGDFKQK